MLKWAIIPFAMSSWQTLYWKQIAMTDHSKKPDTSLSTASFPHLTNQSHRCAILQCWNSRPLPRAFLSSTVADLGQQMRTIRILIFKDVSRDLDQEGVQLRLVPTVETLFRYDDKRSATVFPFLIWLYRTVMTLIKLTCAISSWSIPRTSFIRW